MVLEETFLTDSIMDYVFNPSASIIMDKRQFKYREHVRGIISKNIVHIFEVDGEGISKHIEDYFPFLSTSPEEYRITDDILDKALLLCAEVNAYIKKKQFTPKESRIFYDIKKQIILNLHIFSDRIVDEWSEQRETDGEIFVSYKIRLSNGDTVTFHQPFRNVSDILYKRTAKKNAILENRREYHHETDYQFTLTEDEKKEMYKQMNILSILNLVTKRYFMKQVQEKKSKTI